MSVEHVNMHAYLHGRDAGYAAYFEQSLYFEQDACVSEDPSFVEGFEVGYGAAEDEESRNRHL